MSFQKLILCGELVTEPELRYTQSGAACCAFRLKTADSWVGRDGQLREEVEVHRIIVWGPDGERASKELKKGQTALVEGKNKTRKWMSENNHEVDITEVIAVPGGVKFLGGGPATKPAPIARPAPAQAAPKENPAPAPVPTSAVNPSSPEAKKPAKALPIKPAPPKPDKVPVDLLQPEVAEDLPF